MTPSNILPDIQFSIVCEDIRREVGGMFTAVGVVSVIPVPQVPFPIFKLFLLNRWTCGVGQFLETVRLLGPDGTTVLRKSDIRFALKDATQTATNMTFLGQLQLPAAGLYQIEVLVNDVRRLRFPLPVVLVQPPPGSEAPAPSPEEPAGNGREEAGP
jgi:hypothetical protein